MDRYRAVVGPEVKVATILLTMLFAILFLSFALQAQTAGDTPVIRLEGQEVGVGEEALVKLILASAPKGLQKYDITVSIRDSSIARICCARGVAIGGLFFQVVEQTESSIELRALDLFGTEVGPGARDVTLAEIKVVGLRGGRTGIDVRVNLFIDDEGYSVVPEVESGLLEVVAPAPELLPIGDSVNPPKIWMATASMRISTEMGGSQQRMSPCSPSISTARSSKCM